MLYQNNNIASFFCGREIGQIGPSVNETIGKKMVLKSLKSALHSIYLFRGELGQNIPPFQLSFNSSPRHGQHLLAIADEDGELSIINTSAKEKCRTSPPQDCYSSAVAKWTAHMNAIFDVIWCDDDTHIVTGAGDQKACIWDVETSQLVYCMQGHEMSVKCVRQMPDCPTIFATGSRDGNVLLWDSRVSTHEAGYAKLNAVHCLPQIHGITQSSRRVKSNNKKRRRLSSLSNNQQRSVTCVEFSGDGNQLLTAGAVDGMVKFWDIRKLGIVDGSGLNPTRSYKHISANGRRYGISSISFDHTKTKLLVSAANSELYIYDILRNSSSPDATFHGHLNSSFYVKSAFSPDSDFIVSGSVDHNLYIWDVESSKDAQNSVSPILTLKGHLGEVSGVSWCSSDFTKIASCSDDTTVRVWDIKNRCSNSSSTNMNGSSSCNVASGSSTNTFPLLNIAHATSEGYACEYIDNNSENHRRNSSIFTSGLLNNAASNSNVHSNWNDCNMQSGSDQNSVSHGSSTSARQQSSSECSKEKSSVRTLLDFWKK